MRLITVAFPSPAAFLKAYDLGTLFVRTRTDAALGEMVLAEISFPGLPNRPLVRAEVEALRVDEDGLKLRISEEDASTRDFLLGMARGELRVEATVHRDHKRFPAALPVRYAVAGEADAVATVDDLGAGGCFVRTAALPAVGATVALRIDAPDGELHVEGVVAWVREGDHGGFGVDFTSPTGADGRRLRTILRHAQETGEVDIAGDDGTGD
jgi:Tfp pilus assembly protein PilZ